MVRSVLSAAFAPALALALGVPGAGRTSRIVPASIRFDADTASRDSEDKRGTPRNVSAAVGRGPTPDQQASMCSRPWRSESQSRSFKKSTIRMVLIDVEFSHLLDSEKYSFKTVK